MHDVETDSWPFDEFLVAEADRPRWHCPDGTCNCDIRAVGRSFAFAVMLHDQAGLRMPGALYRSSVTQRQDAAKRADDHGWAIIEVRHPPLDTVLIAWAPADVARGSECLPFYARYHVVLGDDETLALCQRLENLGYAHAPAIEDRVRAFERDHRLPITGRLDAVAPQLVAFHDLAQLPERRDGGLSVPPPSSLPAGLASYQPYGGGTVPGQGSLRAALALRRIRLKNHEYSPAAGVRGEAYFGGVRRRFRTDGCGVADLWLPVDLERLDLSWEQQKTEVFRRDVRVLALESQGGTGSRLHNLGYEVASLSEQLDAYRREHGVEKGVPQSTVEADVHRWHDGGPSPGGSGASTDGAGHPTDASLLGTRDASTVAQGSRVRPGVNTVCSNIIVDLFRDRRGRAPYRRVHPRNKANKNQTNLWMLGLWKGQHSAISFDDFPKAASLFSGNPINAVPGRGEGAFFNVKEGKRRHIFLHGWYMGKARGEQISMLSLRKGCDIFQVRTYDWPKSSWGQVVLYGKSLALHAEDVPATYRLTINQTVYGNTSMADVVKIIDRHAPLTHLVISAHGAFSSLKKSFKVRLGRDGLYHFGTTDQTTELFTVLNGRVKYIWILSCSVGMDRKLMSRLAEVTGAWVVAHGMAVTNIRVPRGHVDWQLPASPRVWKHDLADPKHPMSPIHQYRLFHAARQSASADLFETGLDFNLVRVRKG
ncbi:MAG: peptidoglycan-binding domain-containing protein [Myxococcota bacterium]